MTAIFHRSLRETPPLAAGGDGVHLIDAEGETYLDASGGAAVSCLGHGHPRVIEAICEQASKLAFAHTAFFTSEPAERLAEFLLARAPRGIGKVYYVSGGSEAIEAALKLTRHYHVARGEPERTRFIARRQSYHGNTLGALAAAQFFDAARRDLPEIPEALGRGDFVPLMSWLRDKVHGAAARLTTDQLLEEVTGRPLDPAVFKAHLKARYLT